VTELMYWEISDSQLTPRRSLGSTLLFYQRPLLDQPFVLTTGCLFSG